MRFRGVFVLTLALALAACGAPQTAPAAQTEPPLDITTAPTQTLVMLPTGTSVPPSATPAPTDPPTAVPTQLPSNPTAATPTAPLFLEPTPRGGPTSSPATGATAEVTAAPVPQSAAPGAQTAGGATLSAPATGDAERAVTGKPVRLVIERIAVDRKLIAVGLDKNRLPVVPDHDVGWYTLGAQPGQGENVVLWGHVLRFRKTPDIPAPFAQLKELKEGDAVTLYDAQGNAYRYVVTQQVWATPDEVEYMLPSGREQVTMISCIGDKVIEDGSVEMTHRLITIAEPDA